MGMRIGDIDRNNYQDFLNLLGLNNSQNHDSFLAVKQPLDAEKTQGIKPPKQTNSWGLTGMFVTSETKRELVPLSEDVTNRLINFERDLFLENYGIAGNFKEQENIFRTTLTATAEKDRINVAHTMGETMLGEARRIHSLVEDAIPGWKPGDVFDRDFVRSLIEGKSLDRRV